MQHRRDQLQHCCRELRPKSSSALAARLDQVEFDRRWPAALGLSERGASAYSVDDPVELQRWREIQGLSSEEAWTSFLATQGLTEGGLVAASKFPGEPSAHVNAPSWVRRSAELAQEATGASGVIAFVRPWIRWAREELRAVLRELNAATEVPVVGPRVASGLSKKLEEDLVEFAIRPILLEAEIAEGIPGGRSSRAYLNTLSSPDIRLEILGHYPGLGLTFDQSVKHWIAAASEFLHRFAEDLDDLRAHFTLPESTSLEFARFAASDPHDDGRRVIVAKVSSGDRLVYKPRSLGAFEAFQNALRQLNDAGFTPKFSVQRVLPRCEWGWVEYVAACSCTNKSKIARFYRRLGGQLALLRIVGATDCHFENLIASGEHPQLVDLETLFQPLLVQMPLCNADRAAIARVANSVLSTGLLPEPTDVKGRIVDLSGLGARSHQETPLRTFNIKRDDDGRLRVMHEQYRLGTTSNRPRYRGREADPREYISEILLGHRRAYQLLLGRKRDFVLAQEVVEGFRGLPVRVVLRPTATYSTLLRKSRHPNALYDGGERDRVLSQLWEAMASKPWLVGAISEEFRQLRNGDIPFFRTSSDSVDICAKRCARPLVIGRSSGVDVAFGRLRSMGSSDLAFQLSLIETSIRALGAPSSRGRFRRSFAGRAPSPMKLASQIGERLMQHSIRNGEEVTWIVPRPPSDAPCARLATAPVKLIASDLYGGLAGVVVFLSHLARLTGDPKFYDLAQATARTLQRRLSAGDLGESLGAFDGLAGAVYAFSHIGVALEDPAWLQSAVQITRRLPDMVGPHSSLDLISGLPGAILSVLALGAATQGPEAATTLMALSAELATQLQKRGEDLPYHRGASHGLSGAMWAMTAAVNRLKVHEYTLRSLIRRDLELTKDGIWIDPDDNLHVGQATWCHGPPGIALCRAAAAKLIADPQLKLGTKAALAATLKAELPTELGLCHGLAGTLEALHSGARNDLGPRGIRRHAAFVARILRSRVNEQLQENLAILDVSAMIGLSGIGLELLRLADGTSPSVLLLEPPCR